MDSANSPTLNAFNQQQILITGTTGFVGKVILEKLLRSVPTIGRIHLLIRGNAANPSARERFLNEVATSSIFDTLKARHPQRFEELCNEKLRFITGELTEPNFGLSDHEFQQLAQKTDLIINSAASVNFREPLDQALQTNTLSLHSIIKLAKVKKSPVVHVSTCYVNGYNTGVMPEDTVPPKHGGISRHRLGYFDVEPLIAKLQHKIVSLQSRHRNKKDCEKALIDLGISESNRYGWNDTYTFTKWLGEQILAQQLQGQTLTIVRPSIVESTLQEPVPGWIEGVKVADAIILAYAREKVTFFPGNKNGIIDIVPADLVANSIILGSAEALTATPAHHIYQCSSSHCNPIPIKRVIKHVQDEAMQNFAEYKNLFLRKPRRPFIMVPNVVFRTVMGLAYRLLTIRSNILTRVGVTVSSAKMANLETAMKLAIIFSFYTQPRYTFSNEKLCALSERMGEQDQSLFPVNGALIEWDQYLQKIHLAGLDQYSLAPKKAKPKQKQVRKQTEAA